MGRFIFLGEDVTNYSPEKRAKYLSRVFQDPKMGTAPRMTVAENLLVAKFRGEKRGLIPRHLASYKAALDPKTSQALMTLTDEFVKQDALTALMITHHMEDALKYGNRLIVMKDGHIVQDLNQEEKAQMTIADYYQLFEKE